MANGERKPIVAAASPWLILQWILSGELWRLGYGEDPHWGEPVNQITIQSAIHELASKITDQAVRKQVQSSVAAGMAKAAQKIAKEAE